jgi:hypothetical protein
VRKGGVVSFAEGYVDVATRISEFRAKYPEGCLQPADPTIPYRVEDIGGKQRIVVVAAAYRTPLDPRPGIGMAYEEVPGKTQFTRDSELQNAETSAWGRAIVAVLAADTKQGVASQDEVRNRQADRETPPDPLTQARAELWAYARAHGFQSPPALAERYAEWARGELLADADEKAVREFLTHLQREAA